LTQSELRGPVKLVPATAVKREALVDITTA